MRHVRQGNKNQVIMRLFEGNAQTVHCQQETEEALKYINNYSSYCDGSGKSCTISTIMFKKGNHRSTFTFHWSFPWKARHSNDKSQIYNPAWKFSSSNVELKVMTTWRSWKIAAHCRIPKIKHPETAVLALPEKKLLYFMSTYIAVLPFVRITADYYTL